MTGIGNNQLPMIRATLLGDVRIHVGERMIGDDAWPRRSARSLFLLLLTTRGHALPKERALECLWPESSPELGKNNLAKALHALRRVLEPDLGPGEESSYVDARGGMIRLLPDVDLWVDADAFEAGLRQAALVDVVEPRSHLRTAVALYGGEYLPTDPYEDWPVARRESLRHAWEGAILDLATQDQAANEPQGSVGPLESLLASDPTIEEAHRAPIRVYAATGQRDRALRQYARCRSALEDELGTEPDRETKALYATIQAAEAGTVARGPVVSARFNNLPVPPNAIVGRDRDADRVQGLVWRQDVRLVTLTGPGGVGKTRLAIAAAAGLAEDFADGIAFVALATVTDPDLVLSAIAATLGVDEEPDQPVATTLQARLGQQELLLVLDNVEQVLEAATGIGNLLESCAFLTVLVTSRERLRLRGEHVYEVPPLAVPHPDRVPAPDTLARYGSVALLQQHLRMIDQDFEITSENSGVVTAICGQLEGLPLAIELAAARVRFQGLRALHDGLASRLDTLKDGHRDLPPRQRTLRDTIAWSYDLLVPAERRLFRQLGVFIGGCTRAAAEAVCAVPEGEERVIQAGLQSLTEKHLIRWEETDDGHRWMMLETIREFALERLRESGDEREANQRHANHYLDLAMRAEQDLSDPHQVTWTDQLGAELGNLRSALGWALTQPDETGVRAVRAVVALWRFWWAQGRSSEGISWLDQVLIHPHTPPDVRVNALVAMAELFEVKSDYVRAAELYNEALVISREQGDHIVMASALGGLGQIAQDLGDYAQATAFHQEALQLYREAGHRRNSAGSLNNLASVAYYQGDIDHATVLWEEALAIVGDMGDDWAVGMVLGNLGSGAMTQGRFDDAAKLHKENLAIARKLNDPGGIGRALVNLAEAMGARGEGDQDALLVEALDCLRRAEEKQSEVSVLVLMGSSAIHRGDIQGAASLYAESLTLCVDIGDRTTIANIAILERIAAMAAERSQLHKAVRLIGGSEALRRLLGAPLKEYLRPIHDRVLAQAILELGENAATSALAEGQAMEPDATLREALAICEIAQRDSGRTA